MSEEQKKNISDTLKVAFETGPESHPRFGKTHTPETLAKIKANRTAPAGENHYRYGTKLSEEVRQQIGDAQRGVWRGEQKPEHYEKTLISAAKGRVTLAANTAAGLYAHTKPSPQVAVFAKFRPEVLAKYDFTNAVYVGALKPITGIICPLHGEFKQYAAQLRKPDGAECPACGEVRRRQSLSGKRLDAPSTP